MNKSNFKFSAIVLRIALLLFALISPFMLIAGELTGRVTDALTGEPLAFVHILVKDSRQGTMTDIDGVFRITTPKKERDILIFSYVGYHSLEYMPDPDKEFLAIKLYPKPVTLQEVVVYPGENPAHRIIRNAMRHRSENDPHSLNSFSYHAYNKLVATLDRDFFEERWQQRRDSSDLRITDFLDRKHLFMMESITRRNFRSPSRSSETVLANRVSGLENPVFTMLATELQPFSFYGNHITLLDQEYVSPLNKSAFNRYYYNLEDSLYQDTDTVYVIAFRPAERVNFNGLKGLLYIHTDNWAIQNVIAQPAMEMEGGMTFRIQQKYGKINGNTWFPVQLNTDIEITLNPDSDASRLPVRATGRSYIKDVVLNPSLGRSDFSGFNIDFDPQANRAPDSVWQAFRIDTLSAREVNTYQFMDSLGQHHNFEGVFNRLEPILFGEYSLGVVSILLNDLYRYNAFEQHRPGIGLRTNRGFSRIINAGGHYAWGSGDDQNKYGYWGELQLYPLNDLRIGGAFKKDVSERGAPGFMEKRFLINATLFRNFYTHTMDYTRQNRVYFSWRMWQNFLQFELYGSRGKTWWTDDYLFRGLEGDEVSQFRFARAGLRLRFAYGEIFMNSPTRVIQLPSAYPVFYFNVTRGFQGLMDGEIDYLRLESKMEINYPIALLGEHTWQLEAGWVSPSNLPWPLLFTARAAGREGWLASPFSFGTMEINEFMANRYFSVFFQHNFQSLLFRTPRYTPELVLIANAGWGVLENPENHNFGLVQGWEKGFYETGFVINKILPQHWVRRIARGFSPGIEMLYRLGPYQLDNPTDNLTLKVNLLLAF